MLVRLHHLLIREGRGEGDLELTGGEGRKKRGGRGDKGRGEEGRVVDTHCKQVRFTC